MLLFNLSDSDFEGMQDVLIFILDVMLTSFICLVQEGDRIAQLVIEKIHTPDVVEVNVSNPALIGCTYFGA